MSSPHAPAAPAVPGSGARFERLPAGGPHDGVWRPASHDEEREVAALLPLLEQESGAPVTRVTLDIGSWTGLHARHLQVAGHRVRIGWFDLPDRDSASFGRGNGPRLVLRVVWPVADAPAA
jgi:hypothetical protein